jgi:hypothetical protein
MFDEVNEATAMFKLAARRQDAPDQGYWLTLDADGFTLPSEWYLRLAGEISRGFHGGTPLPAVLPDNPGPRSNPAIAIANAALAPEAIGVATGMPATLESLVVIDSTGSHVPRPSSPSRPARPPSSHRQPLRPDLPG